MLEYLIKRILLMIPTFLGISLLIWLVMTMAPGEPAGGQTGPSDGTGGDAADAESGDKSQRNFRKQFGLDRPRFYNDWASLGKEEVLESIQAVRRGIGDGPGQVSPKEFKKAKRRLQDWQHFAVPPLVELLNDTQNEPTLQDHVLGALRKSAYTFRKVYPKGYVPSDEERARDKQVDAFNQELDTDTYRWTRDATADERESVVKNWKVWFAENKGTFEYTFWEDLKVRFTDTQFGKYWGGLLSFDLGISSQSREPVIKMILGRLKYSLSLAVPAFLIAWMLAVFLGVFSSTHHNSAADQSLSVSLYMLYSIPAFVMGTILQRWLAVEYGWFPVEGFESPGAQENLTTWEHFKDVLWHITLPLIVYTYGGLTYISRQARSGMLQVLKSDFVRTARAKGLPERTVIWRHAVRNGIMPIVTLLGTALPVLIAGSVFIETIFNINGFGLLMIKSILQKDYNVVMAIQLLVAALTLIGLLLTDIIYAAMDPRITFK